MPSNQLNNVPNLPPQSAKGRQNVVLVFGLGLLALATWQAGKSGACFGGACMIPDFARMNASPRAEPVGPDKLGEAEGRVATSATPTGAEW